MNSKQEIIPFLSNNLKFLITCCQAEQSEENIIFIINYISDKNESQLDDLISLSAKHGILPLFYKTIKKISIENKSIISPTFFAKLKALYIGISQRNMLMSAELIRIMKLFEKHNIEALAFKGPVLSQMAYGDITLRQYGDLDILIKKKDRESMMSIILQAGYIPEISLGKGTKETFFNCVNVIGFHHPGSHVRIEVHWELLSVNYAIDWEEATLWKKTESIQINRHTLPLLPTEQLLLYLCAHGAKHLFERLEWVCDIDRSIISNPGFDWDRLLIEAETLGIKRMLYLGLKLSQQFFNLKLPKYIHEEIAQDKTIPELINKVIQINFSEASKQGKSYSSFGLLWHMRENLRDQLRFTWRGLFSPKFDDFVFIQLPKHLAFLYPFIRPYRLVRKYFKL